MKSVLAQLGEKLLIVLEFAEAMRTSVLLPAIPCHKPLADRLAS